MLINLFGLSEHNKRLDERRLEQQARRYDIPRPRGTVRYLNSRGHGGPRRQQHGPLIPMRHPPYHVVRDFGHGALGVVPVQPNGLPINYYDRPRPRRRPPYHQHPPHGYVYGRRPPQSPEFDMDTSDCSSCAVDRYGSPSDSSISDMDSLAETLEDLSLRRRPSYERLRPVGLHDYSHNHPRARRHQILDHHDEYRRHDHHRHLQDHHHHQHGHSPHRGPHRELHGHYSAGDYDDLNGHVGDNRVPGLHDRDTHRTGGWTQEDQNATHSATHSDADSAESW